MRHSVTISILIDALSFKYKLNCLHHLSPEFAAKLVRFTFFLQDELPNELAFLEINIVEIEPKDGTGLLSEKEFVNSSAGEGVSGVSLIKYLFWWRKFCKRFVLAA